MEAARFFNFRLSEIEFDKLSELSRKTGRTKAQILRELITRPQIEPRVHILDIENPPERVARID